MLVYLVCVLQFLFFFAVALDACTFGTSTPVFCLFFGARVGCDTYRYRCRVCYNVFLSGRCLVFVPVILFCYTFIVGGILDQGGGILCC